MNKLLTVSLVLIGTIVIWFSNRLFIVQTGSMAPEIPGGSVVVIFPSNKYSISDVVTYSQGKNVVTHRIVDVKELSGGKIYFTKGDANSFIDPKPVSNNEILGRVIIVAPHIGNLVSLLVNPWILLLMFYIPFGLIFGYEVRKNINLEERFS
jgi:signal peptidase I